MLDFNSVELNTDKLKENIDEISTKHIAIIGMSIRMPMAENKDEFWNNLKNGRDCIKSYPEVRKKDSDNYLKYCGKDINSIKYSEGAYLSDIDKFDYSFFNISPKEASLMSPVQRLFLENSWKAIEDAGYGGKKIIGSRTGVYLGYEADMPYDYKKIILDVEPSALSVTVTGNLTSIIASRISYILDLQGPSMCIDTACSSSLVAVHTACKALRSGECDMALAGSVRINFLPIEGQLEFGINSSNGRTRTFDASSDGTGSGEGVATILLKPYSSALRDHDNIYAIIRGSAVNQDGKSIGITAPSAKAQEAVIVEAWKDANISCESISYIEAHGTGTRLGDPIEIQGIKRAFERYTTKKQFCGIGSVKTNIGHLDNAAGIAGIIKSILSLQYKQIPPSLHFKKPNSEIDLVNSPVYLNHKLTDWETDGVPRRCGVSSFGFSGTNCHVVLEEVKERKLEKISEGYRIFTISAKSEKSLNNLVYDFIKFLGQNCQEGLNHICYTVNTGRSSFDYRLAIIAESVKDLLNKLQYVMSVGFNGIEKNNIFYNKVLAGELENQLDQVIREIEQNGSGCWTKKSLLEKMCTKYINGYDFDWDVLVEEKDKQILSLPTYVFDKKRCWIETPIKEDDIIEESNLYFNIGWENQDRDIKYLSHSRDNITVIFRNDEERSDRLIKCMKEDNLKIIEVRQGNNYKKISDVQYIMSSQYKDYIRLLKDLDTEEIGTIVHTLTIREEKELEEELFYGVYSLLNLIKALHEVNYVRLLNLNIITEYAYEVTGEEEKIVPENASLIGFIHALKWENTNINFKCVDIDCETDIQSVFQELNYFNGEMTTAYRNGQRYSKTLKPLELNKSKINIGTLKNDGVYIITGGTGGIAQHIKKYFLSFPNIHIALISRSKVLEETEDIQIQGRQSIEFCEADVTNKEQMDQTITYLRQKYGTINGIVHCAGNGLGNLAHLQEKEDFDRIIAAKTYGTNIIDELTKNDSLDFFVLFSSAITLIGGIGSGAYTAANSYLDAYANMKRRMGKRFISINWPAWKNTGLATKTMLNEEKEIFKNITPILGVKAFNNIINTNVGQVFVGKLNIESNVLLLKDLLPFKLDEKLCEFNKICKDKESVKVTKKAQIEHVRLKGKGMERFTNIEKDIGEIWKEVLGYQEIDINGNFFEIGGDSLLITKVHQMIDELYPQTIRMSDLFAFPTIYKLSEYISSKVILEDVEKLEDKEDEKSIDLDKLLDDLENGNIDVAGALDQYVRGR